MKRITLTDEEKAILEVIMSMEIQSDVEYKKIGIEPAFSTEQLKALYKKIAGYEWE